jgi:hypothetical protein
VLVPVVRSLVARRRDWLICAGFLAVFAVHALNYAYFFVDDEAIPFVYAQNIIDGQGVAYNPDDGPVEGYSNFLTIWIDAVILGIVRVVGSGRLRALALAELFAFACAIALIGITYIILLRRSGADRVPLLAGVAFLALAGPLAVWSSSGLETTLFALLTAVLVRGLLESDRSNLRVDGIIALSVVGMLLCRVDGFIWVAAIVFPFLIAAPRNRWREIAVRIALPALAVFIAYHGWRVMYFGELLPMPVHAKVLYKMWDRTTLVSNDPAQPYVVAFLGAYRGIPLVALCLGFAGAYRHQPMIRSLAIAIVLVTAYLWVVGDWMFGFRFFVPLLAPIAVVAAAGFGELRRWRPRVGLAAAVIWTVALGGVAYDFSRTYERVEKRESWIRHPSLDPGRFFGPYYQNYLAALAYAGPGDTIAYNQAGFVPFMLGAHNVDDLGICTKFYAKLPTTDVVFTEVGRYTPLTGRPVLRAGETYTLSRAPKLVMTSTRDLRSANRGAIPTTVLAGTYKVRFSNRSATGYMPVDEAGLRHPILRYMENLAHISHLERASINGRRLDPSEYRGALRYLYSHSTHLRFHERYTADFIFSDTGNDVYELYFGGVRSPEGATLEVTLQSGEGGPVYRDSFELIAEKRREIDLKFDHGLKAAGFSMAIESHAAGEHELYLDDVRVQGQTTELKRFLQDYRSRNAR